MAHDLYTPTQAARSVLAALRYLTTLPRTVNQNFSSEFVAGRGRTVDVPLPISAGASREYTDANRAARDAIVFDDLTQATTPVTMDTQVYKAVRLPDDFNTFTLTSLEQQVLRPQAESVVDGVTAPLLTVMNAVATDTSIPTLLADGSNVREVVIAARRVLNSRKVPMSDRYIAVGPAAEAAFLNDELLQKANESGSDGQLREAIIGRLFGFTIVTDPNLVGNAGEVQTITEGGSGLTSFTLTYGGQTTGSLAAAATAAQVQAALEALSNIAAGEVSVSGANGGPYTVTWDAGTGNVAQMTATPTGGTGTVTIATTSGGDEAGFGVAYHRDAFAHVMRPSRPPEGAAKSAIVAQDGFALRWLMHYNPLQLEDQSVVDAFVGAKLLSAERAVSFDMTA